MNFRVIFSCILGIAILSSCSGWKKTSKTTFTTNSSSQHVNVDVKGKHFNLTADDDNATLTIGSKPDKKSNTTYLFKDDEAEIIDDKHFLNGDRCKRCDYLIKRENSQGNLEESEVSNKYKNGEEREYHHGRIIRSSYYVDGAKSGMEYTYANEKIVDSVYIETIYNNQWDEPRLRKALPAPASNYIYSLYFKENYYGFAITTYDSMATHIYHKALNDTTSGLPLVATIEYKNRREPSDFKVNLRKPFFETLEYEKNELVARQKIKGNVTVYDFKKDRYLKELYPNGKTKHNIVGGVRSKADESWQCSGECHSKSFYENGTRWEESYYTNGKIKQEMRWNRQNVLVYDCNYPRYSKSFYDDGSLEQEMRGELKFDTLNIIAIKNGFVKEFYPDGKPKRDDTYEDGKYVTHKTWYPNGNIDIEAEVPKYMKQYYENGQLEKSDEGEIKQENDELVLVNGTLKLWYPNGKLALEAQKKDNNIITAKTWDSTGFQEVDFERGKYLKSFANAEHSLRVEWSGSVVFDGVNEYSCNGDCTKKTYDSTGKKTTEKVFHYDTLLSKKSWNSKNGQLEMDYNSNSYLKQYSKSQKLLVHFKGKSTCTDTLAFIDGTETRYYENGKKSSETVWKDGNATGRKEWNDSGKLTTEFEFNKTLVTYYPNAKAVKMRYEGTVYFNDHSKKYIVTDGTLQSFDENGKLASTKKYVKGFPIGQ